MFFFHFLKYFQTVLWNLKMSPMPLAGWEATGPTFNFFFFLIIPFVRKLQKSVFSFWNVLCFLFCLIYTGHKRAWKVCDVDAQGQEVFFPLWAKQRLLWRQTAFIAWPHLIRVCLPDLAPGDLIAHSCALSNPRCSAFLPHTCTKASSLPSQGCRFWRQITSSTAIKM